MTTSSLASPYKSGLRNSDFQRTLDGKQTDLYILTNKNGYEISITNYGGAIYAECSGQITNSNFNDKWIFRRRFLCRRILCNFK